MNIQEKEVGNIPEKVSWGPSTQTGRLTVDRKRKKNASSVTAKKKLGKMGIEAAIGKIERGDFYSNTDGLLSSM